MVVYITVSLAFTNSLHMLHCEHVNDPQDSPSESFSIFMLSWLAVPHLPFFFFPLTPVLVRVEIHCDVKGTVRLYDMILLLPLPFMTLDNPTDMLKIKDLSLLTLLCLIVLHIVFQQCFLALFSSTLHPLKHFFSFKDLLKEIYSASLTMAYLYCLLESQV